MNKKVRKQIYIEPEQERLLKRSSERTGLTEAQIIRNAIDIGMSSVASSSARPEVWKEELAYIRRRMKKGSTTGGRSWRRSDLYERQ